MRVLVVFLVLRVLVVLLVLVLVVLRVLVVLHVLVVLLVLVLVLVVLCVLVGNPKGKMCLWLYGTVGLSSLSVLMLVCDCVQGCTKRLFLACVNMG